MQIAEDSGTIKDSILHCPKCKKQTSIAMIRGDRRFASTIEYGLRPWENNDLIPRSDDVFKERLYCIRWVETCLDQTGKPSTNRHYSAPTEKDLAMEQKVLELLEIRFDMWQERGYIPKIPIKSGDKTDELIRTRGWTYWHHLFNPISYTS